MAPPAAGGGGGGGGGGLPGGPSAATGAAALPALSSALSAAAAQVQDLTGEEEGAGGEFQFPPIVLDSPGVRVSFPLRLNHATSYVAPRVALVGDAAHTVHPLAGQGLNLGMADIGALAAVLGDGAAAGRDVGEELLLRTYEEERKGANLAMSAVCDVTKRLFSTTPPAPGSAAAELLHASPEALARNLGMEVLNETPPLKRLVAKVAMGGKLMPF
jgi:2-polyprenyl-6-methoxyphenol hydroxylase-like FAD-dependent oxidoreductase